MLLDGGGAFYQGCHQRHQNRGKCVSERFNDSFPSKKYRNKTRSKYRSGTQESARRQRLLCRMLRGYSDWDQEDTCCWDAESSPLWWPHATRPRRANMHEKRLRNTAPKEAEWRLTITGTWYKRILFPASCCHDSAVAEACFPDRLKVNKTLGYSGKRK